MIRRWNQHVDGSGAKFLRAHKPEEMVFIEQHSNRSDVCKREYQIKRLSKNRERSLDKENLLKEWHTVKYYLIQKPFNYKKTGLFKNGPVLSGVFINTSTNS